ncbi:hypothetical protein N0V93_008170 [Gnomoniopsis smithogilvyi]|uniref:Uncharacterized protein n=1 Tax=Gnomoniopsis smithogilvyi TaxID=1191159 RepID=A0A9W8YL76_9PEZI|nr:hypothetical protein N0V93_008170 [Gnomoniopsis smithogilvyi]
MAAVLAERVWDRKAGRYDYSRFDHIASTSASVGYQFIGKVGVDCRFLFRQSKWGTLGPVDNPAGIIYMELNFDQPPDCTLDSATIQLTLDEDDPGLDPYRVASLPSSECPVLITDYYGPGQIVGTSKRVLVNKSRKIEPSVNVAGNGGSLGGVSTHKAFEHESRWMFQSHRVPGPRNRGQKWGHRILKWEMTENDIEKYPVHSNKVFTAFAYEHSGQPFLMKVEISGKLRQRTNQMKASLTKNLKKFGPRARKQEDIATTLIGAYLGRRRPLDELARGLASAMELKNHGSSPVVLPGPQAAAFQEMEFATNPAVDHASVGTSNQASIEEGNSPLQPRLNWDSLTQTDVLNELRAPSLQERTQPTLQNLARVGEYFRTPIKKVPTRRGSSEASGHSSAATLVAETSEATRSMVGAPKKVDEDITARVMEVAFLRLLIQIMVGIMDLFKPRDATQDKATEKEVTP